MKSAVAFAAVGLAASASLASPVINGAALNTRVFNDNPGSNLVTTNNYPSLVEFAETNLQTGFANRHNFRLSSNGGASAHQFINGDSFELFADVTLAGPGNGEGGLQVSPWWSPNVDGQFNLRTSDGEVAVFGGRMPFYSFTANHGVNYVKGTTVRVGIEYTPNTLDAANPARIRYTYGAFSSGWIAFDPANPIEVPVYGDYGMLNQAQVGGFVQILGGAPGSNGLTASFANISYVPTPGAAGLLGAMGLVALRRRR